MHADWVIFQLGQTSADGSRLPRQRVEIGHFLCGGGIMGASYRIGYVLFA